MTSQTYRGKTALIIGLGLSGRAAAKFLIQQGAVVHGTDSSSVLLEENADILALRQLGMVARQEKEIRHIQQFDLIVASPGIPSTHPFCRLARELNREITGEIELGCRALKTSHLIIGITGTNGKTTTTLLVTHLLNKGGKKARALGNVGVPLTQEMTTLDPGEIIVLELSSYQLETLRQPVLHNGIILNVTPDHLDRYHSMEAYAAAKFCMEHCLKKGKSLYLEEQTFKNYGHLLRAIEPKTYGYSKSCFIYTDLESVFMKGKKVFSLPCQYRGRKSHDLENLMASYAVSHEFGLDGEQVVNGLETFKKPPHRMEWVLDKEGVFYYDDSKGTNIDAVIRAVQSLKGEIILIAGGMDKGSPYTPWIEAFVNRVKYICAIGQAARKIQAELSSHIPVQIFENLEQAVKYAARLAKKGDNVLLSPGCSSLDMFKDYAHRGKEFQHIVRQL